MAKLHIDARINKKLLASLIIQGNSIDEIEDSVLGIEAKIAQLNDMFNRSENNEFVNNSELINTVYRLAQAIRPNAHLAVSPGLIYRKTLECDCSDSTCSSVIKFELNVYKCSASKASSSH